MNIFEPFTHRLGQAVDPIARLTQRLRIGPNAITTTGLVVMLAAATAFAGGAVRWGGALVLIAALFDVLDGRVARLAGRTSTFGAFYDATMDRVGEAGLCGGVALFFLRGGVAPGRETFAVMAAIAALAATLIASYARARAEGLGVEAGVGIPTPAARLLALGAPSLAVGAGPGGAWLVWMVVVFAVVTAATAVQRVVHVARAAAGGGPGRASTRRDTLPGRAPALRKGP
jgi:CDP-diacylglycerol--glycerol-3-phosphate 3-phosphatidyltransferase